MAELNEDYRLTADDACINLAYLYVKGATYLMETMTNVAHDLCFEQDYTPEVKRNLKSDMNFTSKAVQYLGRAQDGWRSMMKNLELLESELDKRVKPENFNFGMANTLDLLSVDLAYLMIVNGERNENSRKVHNYLKKFKWPNDLKWLYTTIRTNMARFTR